jgi:hypothetical protein
MGRGGEALAEVTQCPRHYGFCVDRKYDHLSDTSIVPTKRRYSANPVAPDQLVWLIRRNDAILPGAPIVVAFGVAFTFSLSMSPNAKLKLRFVATALALAPSNISNIPIGMKAISPFFTG